VIKEPSIKTDLEVGDGTTTTVFLTYNLYKMFKNKMGFTQTRFVDKLVKEAIEEINKDYTGDAVLFVDVHAH
jgi:chaperonin GroEL (HSP60 family)